MKNEKCAFYDSEDVSQIYSCSKSYAYKIIRMMNKELKKEGYITINGKVPKKYCEKMVYGYNA